LQHTRGDPVDAILCAHCDRIAHPECREREHERTGTLFEQGVLDDGPQAWRVLLWETGMGNERAAVAAERGIELVDPEVVLLIGIAGGIKAVRLGDLVVANKVYQYEYGKQEATFKTRPEVNHRGIACSSVPSR
jgi:nucleoside phosphorylase